MSAAPPPGEVRSGTPAGRRLLTVAVLASVLVLIDGSMVSVALPALGRDLGAGLSGLQWTLNAYLLTLSALLLPAGSLGDRLGRRRLLVVGTLTFAAASLACAAAPSVPFLVGARAVQGVGAALITPASLALIQTAFHPDDRGRAVGAWSGFTGIAVAVGPVLAGWLVGTWSWRLIFLPSVPVAAAVLVAARRVPESVDPAPSRGTDVPGAVLAAGGLAAITYALIETGPSSLVTGLVGLAAIAGFVLWESRSRRAMLPITIFASRRFSGANVVTLAVYAALGVVFFLLIVHLQDVLGYSPIEAGLAAMPVTLLMLGLSSRVGALAQRTGPRGPLTLGPLTIAAGTLLMTRIEVGTSYVSTVLPAVVVFGLGLAVTVAPLTATVLDAADPRYVGAASAVNNVIARTAGMVAVAGIPLLAGLAGGVLDPAAFAEGFRRAMTITAGVAAVGSVLGFATMGGATCGRRTRADDYHCSMAAPPLRVPEPSDAAR